MRFWLVLFITNFAFISCATPLSDLSAPSPRRLPSAAQEQDLERLSRPDRPRNQRWWALYQLAQQAQLKGEAARACELFAELAAEPLFRLNEVARLRAYQSCPLENSEALAQLGDLDWSSMAPWMRAEALDAALRLAEFQKNKEKIMELAFEKSKANLPQAEKVALTQRALEMAQALGHREQKQSFQARIYQLAPRLNPQPRTEDFLTIAHDFRRAREFDQARSFYSRVVEGRRHSRTEKISALRGIRTAYKNERRMEDYLKATDHLARFVEEAFLKDRRNRQLQKSYHDIQLEAARSHWTHNRLSQAQATLNQVIERLQGQYPLHEVYWIFGRMAEEKQEFAQALDWYQKALAEKSVPAEFRERLLWFKAWNLRKLNQGDAAIDTFDELLKITNSDFQRARYRFWLARSLEQNENPKRAKEEYERLLVEDPLGYYGLMAFRQLGHPVRPASQKPRELSISSRLGASREQDPLAEILDQPLVEWLISVNENDLAKAYLDGVSKTLSRQTDSTPRSHNPESPESLQSQEEFAELAWMTLFKYYALAGQYLSLYEAIGRRPAEQRQNILNKSPQLLFPRPHLNSVQKWAQHFSVAPELIYSVMRQESAFNPRARSHADAFGLMQLLPSVAQRTAHQLANNPNSPQRVNIPYAETEDLFDPDINIALGAAHLRELFDRQDNRFILAVASYNASERALRGWLKTRYRGDTLEFIEDIPYAETQSYVRLVMRNYIFYQWMLSPRASIPFPEYLLEI